MKEETAETELPPEPFWAGTEIAKQAKIAQKKRYFIDGLLGYVTLSPKALLLVCL